jgi:hypothetical protein
MMQFTYRGTPVHLWSDHEMRLMDMGGSFIAVQDGMVNLEDLCGNTRPNRIVRCHGNPRDVIQVVQVEYGPVGCVAGWISEDDQ